MRGWRIRELGPGGNEDNIGTNTNIFFQTGDLQLEMNAEFRFDIFWVFKGALFLDVGNVWALGQDERLNANFAFDDIAINTGAGLRIDASIFLLRLDFGLRLRSPFPDNTGRQWLIRTPTNLVNKEFWNPNLAIGYPF